MTQFILFITAPPDTDIKSNDAFLFAKACLENGDAIAQVFFYADAVLTANKYLSVNLRPQSVHQKWVTLAESYDIPLNVCVTASIKRGVLGQHESEFNDFEPPNLIAPFNQVGMADYFSAIKDNPDIVSVQF